MKKRSVDRRKMNITNVDNEDMNQSQNESTDVAGLYKFKICVVNCTKKVVGGVYMSDLSYEKWCISVMCFYFLLPGIISLYISYSVLRCNTCTCISLTSLVTSYCF